jgi:hypothetical protein
MVPLSNSLTTLFHINMKTWTVFSRTGRIALSVSFLFLVSIFFFTQTSYAQKANFSGSWSLNESKSNFGEQGGGGFRMAPGTLTITQQGQSMTIEREATGPNGQSFKSTDKITLDGKECENQSFGGTKKSIATWSSDGSKLTISSTSVFERDGQTMERKSVEIYSLLDGGKTLSVESTFSSPRGERKSAAVYDKK